MLVLVEVVQTTGVETGGSTDDTVDLVALVEQELGSACQSKSLRMVRTPHTNETNAQVRAILTGDAYGDVSNRSSAHFPTGTHSTKALVFCSN
jgi:hypothetical protein